MGLMEPRVCKEIDFLRQKYAVSFSAFIINSRGKNRSRLPDNIDEKLAYIVLYGDRNNKEATGGHLSDKRLYLQHPLINNTSVTYDNPHYFLPPGETLELPEFPDLRLEDGPTRPKQGLLDDALEIFQGAAIPGDCQNVELKKIPGLETALKE